MYGLGENVLCYVELGWIVRFASFELDWTGLDFLGRDIMDLVVPKGTMLD